MAVWTNADGLNVRLGHAAADPVRFSEYRTDGPERLLEIEMFPEYLPTVAQNSVRVSDSCSIPAGAFITYVEIVTTDAWDAGSGTLNVGLVDKDGGTNILDVDGFVVAATVAEINAQVPKNTHPADGDDIETVLSETAWVTWEVDTAAIVGGKSVIRIAYLIPDDPTDTLGT